MFDGILQATRRGRSAGFGNLIEYGADFYLLPNFYGKRYVVPETNTPPILLHTL